MSYQLTKIEKKWQKIWEAKKIYQVKNKNYGKKNFMLLTEFPYPSGNLHIGHWYAYAIPDILARYLKMKGYNVMYPIGFDAFGLPAENAAIKRKINPRLWTEKNIEHMKCQLKSMGTSFDWSRTVSTIDKEYYKWTQWFFLKMYEHGLVYRAKTLVNWCPTDKTVLANEQIVNGKCERCDSEVIQKELDQWMFKITDYADKLIDDLNNLNWPEVTKLAQKNWIGKSEGATIRFKIKDFNSFIEVFTTRADTLFGATYLVLAPEHQIIKNLKFKFKNLEEIEKYIFRTKSKTELERISEAKEKTGVELKGIKAINPANNQEVPVFISDYVLVSYGTGAIMAVPAHDQRDFEFAVKFNLPIKIVVCPNYPEKTCPVLDKAFIGEGYLVGSGNFDGLKSDEARKKIINWLEEKKLGASQKIFRLRDWVLSRQRYWGVPIPMIKCNNCGFIPVPEKKLPVELPQLKDFLPTSDGRSPLAKAKNWVVVLCPKCNILAERETDTMDTFVDSSWYFIRYIDSQNKKTFADKHKMKLWLPVPIYVGGAEHNTMHLLYSRFFTKVLYDLGLIDFDEPFFKRINHGVILGSDSQKMSKSHGNVIDPDDLVKEYGADTVRMYMAFMAEYSQGGPWQSKGIFGISRFLQRVWKIVKAQKRENVKLEKYKNIKIRKRKSIKINKDLERLIHKTIKKVGEDIENFKFNTAISALMILVNILEKNESQEIKSLKILIKLLAPFAPHLSEELNFQLDEKSYKRKNYSIHLEKWPKYDPSLIKEEKITLIIQINGKIRAQIEVESSIGETKAKELALKNEKAIKWLENKQVKKIIFVPGKLINIVT